MKHLAINIITIALLLCFIPASRAALVAKNRPAQQLSFLSQSSEAQQLALTPARENYAVRLSSSVMAELPRGRGNGREAMISFFCGFGSLIPFASLALAPFALVYGIRNTGKKRKRRGYAIAGIIMASIGFIVTAILIVLIATLV